MDKREMTESQLKNLIPFDNSPQGKERASREGRKGIRASHKKRQQNKDFKEVLKAILESDLTENDIARLETMGFPVESLNQWAMIVIAMAEKAKSGDVKAFESLAKVAGIDSDKSPVSVNIGSDPQRVQIYLPQIEEPQE